MGKRGRPRHPDVLTPREWEVLGLVRDGLSNDAIAERLGISVDGVKYHVSEILGKLGVDNRTDAARWVEEPSRPHAWSGALAPLALLRRIRVGWLSGVAAGAAVCAIVAAIAVLAWALASSDGDSTNGAPPAGERSADKIAYVGTDENLWALEGDGPPRRLTDETDFTMSAPQWSPDGRYILFQRTPRVENTRIIVSSTLYLADTRTGDVRPVDCDFPNGAITLSFGRWAPDGRHITTLHAALTTDGTAYLSGSALWLCSLDGAARQLVGPEYGVEDVAWSRDGAQIAFGSASDVFYTDGDGVPLEVPAVPERGVYIVDATGGAPPRVIAQDTLLAALPVEYQNESLGVAGIGGIQWSPDGQWLSFYTVWLAASAQADGLPLFTVRTDGSGLAYHGIVLASPALREWSPDATALAITLGPGRDLTAGKTIALVTPGVPGAQIIAADPAREPTPLGNGELVSARSDAAPAWSPDAASIAFQASETGFLANNLDVGKIEGPREGIWIADADGSNAKQLTSDPAYLDFAPNWSSDGEWVFFVRTDGQPFAGNAEPSSAQLWKVRADGSDAKRVIDDVLRISSYYGQFSWEEEVALWSGGP